ncbi:hypothetical protein Pmani_018429 [Petrolisthes manimaculis]|uniref:Uncharacterized protein n=1 Tax=Petrolisthes manimaculis TaxID=1843537 RepID=A0AAE1U4V0_9EUCA|nr:hypothetical protein Pmani_018429 [Petrolisthes manimaculis]
MAATATIVNAVESICGVTTSISEQHVDLRESRQTRDLLVHNPFNRPTPFLTSISSGIMANEEVNRDDAYAVGRASMKTMEGKVFSNILLQRKNNIKSMNVKCM